MHRAAAVIICLAAILLAAVPASAEHRLGAGIHYWTTVDDIEYDEVDENGFSWVFSYQYAPGLFSFEADLEIFPEEYGGAGGTVLAPQALVLVGSTIYGGVGAGIYYADGDFADDPFFLLRAGLNLELLPKVYLDINANYQFSEFKGISEITEDIDTDTVTLGAFVRMGF